MSLQISATHCKVPTATSISVRRSANYSPSIWGDHFLFYAARDDSMELKEKMQHQELKRQVKTMLAQVDKFSEQLDLIDAIQRLGISYHFESEIDEMLRKMHNFHQIPDDLYTISLKFRLLRQQGYKMPCDVFKTFKDSQGKFKDSIKSDAKGMLSLYEATHMRVHGEDIVDDALDFTTTQLQSMLDDHNLNPLLIAQISHALKQPIRKGLPRLEARHYFSLYEQDAACNQFLLTFAKLDFNILQKLHQKELSDIAKWWKKLDFSNKLPFARDRVIECYFWILGVHFEPEFILGRRILTKVIAVASTIDDIYDVYGTPQELELFTAAIERWDMGAMDILPKYMQVCYEALLDVYTEIEQNMVNQGTLYRLTYAKEAMKNLVRAYFLESKWLHQNYIPTMEEYMPLALATSGYAMLSVTSFVGMGDLVTKESFDWVSNKPKIVKASEIISRLMDDIVSHKFERERGHVASAIECYMNQYGATEVEATHELRKQITNAWKDVNEECLHPTPVPMPLLERILNLVRVMDVVYKDEDGYTKADVQLKDFVSSLLIEPVPI